MRLLKTSLAATSLLFASVQAAVLKRSTIVPLVPFSTVPEPADGSAVAAGQSFPLDYPVSIYPPCPSSLYPLQFFLLDHLPTASDVNPDFSTTGGPLLNPLYQFGDAWLGWTEPGQTPPNIPALPIPPSNLTMPDLSIADGEIYFVVTEVFSTCPGHGAFIDIGVSYSAIQYSRSPTTKRDGVTSDVTAIEYGL